MELSLEPCVVDPATEDWRSMDEASVYNAAKAGVPQAVKELARREDFSPGVDFPYPD